MKRSILLLAIASIMSGCGPLVDMPKPDYAMPVPRRPQPQ